MESETVLDLGLDRDQKLSYKNHVDKTINNGKRFLNGTKSFCMWSGQPFKRICISPIEW